MRSTKQQAKHFIVLEVQREGSSQWGELQTFEYVEGDKFLTRRAALRHADTARMRWTDNYKQFSGAKFRTYDSAAISAPEPARKAKTITSKAGFFAALADIPGVSVMTLPAPQDATVADAAALHNFIGQAIGEL